MIFSTNELKILAKSNNKTILSQNETIRQIQQQIFGNTASKLMVSIVRVPDDVAIVRGERWWIEICQFDITWHYPIQWRRDELKMVEWLVDRIDWTIDINHGYPVKVRSIHAIFEAWIDKRQILADLLEIGEVA